MTATAAAIPEPFHVVIPVDAYRADADYITLERWAWERFGGSEEYADTGSGRVFSYLSTSTESCYVAQTVEPTDSVVRRADGTVETMSFDMIQPTMVNAGDVVMYDEVTSFNCRNAGDARSISIMVIVWAGGEPPLDPTLPGGLSGAVLAKRAVPELPVVPAMLTIERRVLAGGETLAVDPAGVTLVYIEDGALELVGGDVAATVTRDDDVTDEELPPGAQTTLRVGDGVAVTQGGATLTASSTTGTTVLIATLASVP